MKSKELALAELTLRKYERPYKIQGRDLVSKLCLSIGLLQPGDSRDIIVDVLMVLLTSRELTSKEVEEKVVELRKKMKLPLIGIAPSNLRRQLKRLKDLFLIEKTPTHYRITENELLTNIYDERIEQFMLKSIKERVREYFEAVDREFRKAVKGRKSK
jgi:DNA-binding transcriptional ArsR family regulator